MADIRIEYKASSEIRDVISRLGRTEDIRLSPDNTRLAVVDFLENRIFFFSIRIDNTTATPKITIFDHIILSSASLRGSHGIVFLGNHYIIIGSRNGDVGVFRTPPFGQGSRECNIKPMKTINGKGLLLAKVISPGSLDCYKIADDCYRVLVCNNHWHVVTSHTIQIGNSIRIRNHGVLIEQAIKIPDGICVSMDHTWIAVSNSLTGEILIYHHTPDLNKKTPPTAILRGMVCPHGIRFTADGRRLFAVDAASPNLYVFECTSGGWDGVQDPSQSIRLLDDESFYAGRFDLRDGGVKGLEIDRSNTVLLTTCWNDVMGFYDLNEILVRRSEVNRDDMIELCRDRDRSFEEQRCDVLKQQWNFSWRIRHALFPKGRWQRFKERVPVGVRMGHLYLRNRWSRETLLDPSGPALSLTTHGYRLELVFYAIESIGLGSKKPSRITLWLDEAAYEKPPETLRRLQSRGLELQLSENLGPHTKYYPYIDRESDLHVPLVTADDDMLYPRGWLQQLIEANEANPSAVHCFRPHRMRLNHKRFIPYNEWGPCLSTSPSYLNFITGVSGVIYPPNFLQYLKHRGRGFEHCCPAGDDIWLTANALRGGFKIAQVNDVPVLFWKVLGSQKQRLYDTNVKAGGNQYQLMRTFSEIDLEDLRAHLLSEGGNS